MRKIFGIIAPIIGIGGLFLLIILLPSYEEFGIGVTISLAAMAFSALIIGERINSSSKEPIMKNINIKRLFRNTALTFTILVYTLCSLSFMEQGDELTACGVIIYIPVFFIIGIYYLRLIWCNENVTGTKILLLPLLQRINLFKRFKDSRNEKENLVKTVLPVILSFFLCPLITSILYANVYHHNKYSQHHWLIIILLLPLLILIFNFIKYYVQDWIMHGNTNEVD